MCAVSWIGRARLLFLIAGVAASGPAAEAGFVVSSDSIVAEGPSTRFSYSLDVDHRPITPNGKTVVTIFDFAGFVEGSNLQPEGWEFSAALVGPTPDYILPPDAGDLYNLTWRYVGSEPLKNVLLGGFSALTTAAGSTSGYAVTADPRTQSLTRATVPHLPEAADFLNPEPSSFSLLALGVVGLVGGAVARRRRRGTTA